MENLWIFYCLAGLIALGLGDFIKKAVLKKGGDKDIFMFVCFVFYVLVLGANVFYRGQFEITNELLKSALISGTSDVLIPLSVIAALKYTDVSFSLVAIRITSSIFILFIGTLLLGDQLSHINILGFLLGIIAVFLLSGFKFGNKFNLHPKGALAIIIAIVSITISNSYLKYIIENINIPNFMFLKFSISFILLTIYMYIRGKFINFNRKEIKVVLPFSIFSMIVFLWHFLYFLPNIYLLGPLSLGYKILSYSLIVPIILSVILYKDKVDKKKIIALILTLVSLGLFII